MQTILEMAIAAVVYITLVMGIAAFMRGSKGCYPDKDDEL